MQTTQPLTEVRKGLMKKPNSKPSKITKSISGKVYGAVSHKQTLILSDNTTDVILLGGGKRSCASSLKTNL